MPDIGKKRSKSSHLEEKGWHRLHPVGATPTWNVTGVAIKVCIDLSHIAE